METIASRPMHKADIWTALQTAAGLCRMAAATTIILTALSITSKTAVSQHAATEAEPSPAQGLMGIGGKGNLEGLSLALRTDTAGPGRGGYHHFQRGKLLPDGRIAVVAYEGDNHGGGDGADLYTMKQIQASAVGVPLVLDGEFGRGDTSFDFTGASPTQLIVYGTADDRHMRITISGFKNVNGVPVAATETFNGPSKIPGYVRSALSWWSGIVTVDRVSMGSISLGRQLVASSVFFFMTRDGGATRYNEYYPINGLMNHKEQGYQSAVAYTASNKIVLLMYRNIIGSGKPGTVRRLNANGGAPNAWGTEEEVLFSNGNSRLAATVMGYRPIFYSEVFTRPNGDLWTLLQGGPYTWSALSSDEGQTWHLTEWITMARTSTDLLSIVSSSVGKNTFVLDPAHGNRSANFPVGRQFLVWNSRSAALNGVYTVVRADFATQTVVTVAETVRSDGGSGQINLSGVVGVDTERNIFVIGGEEHALSMKPGQMFSLNNSANAANNALYKIISLKVAIGKTLVGVSSKIPHASVSGRIQNASLTEFGIGYLNQNKFIAICRTMNAGPVVSEQFASNGSPDKWSASYLGRPKSSAGGSLVSSFITTTYIDGRTIFTWLFQGRTATGPDPYGVSYRTADALSTLYSVDAWAPERPLVSATTPLRTPDGDVYASGTYINHAYPFAVANSQGRHLVWFSLETSTKTADRYMLSFQPRLPQSHPRRMMPSWRRVRRVLRSISSQRRGVRPPVLTIRP